MEEATGGGGNDRVRNLQSEVEGVKNIMTQNVERILARGENLDHLRNKTEDLEATPSLGSTAQGNNFCNSSWERKSIFPQFQPLYCPGPSSSFSSPHVARSYGTREMCPPGACSPQPQCLPSQGPSTSRPHRRRWLGSSGGRM
nr:vesicle-associated membrane protein 8 isoform X2 [Kogia breviceps]